MLAVSSPGSGSPGPGSISKSNSTVPLATTRNPPLGQATLAVTEELQFPTSESGGNTLIPEAVMLGLNPPGWFIVIGEQVLNDDMGADTCRIVPSSAVKKTEFPSALTSRLASVVAAHGPEVGTVNWPRTPPPGSSSTMLGAGVPPLPALPTNMCPTPSTATAWALSEFVPPLAGKVFTGVCEIVCAGAV